MPRQEGMLVAICLAESGFQLSLYSIEMLVLLMVEASLPTGVGGGENLLSKDSKANFLLLYQVY